MQLLFGPIVQDMHEFLNFVKKLLILIVELDQLGTLLIIFGFEVNFELLLPLLFHILQLAGVVQFFELRLG